MLAANSCMGSQLSVLVHLPLTSFVYFREISYVKYQQQPYCGTYRGELMIINDQPKLGITAHNLS